MFNTDSLSIYLISALWLCWLSDGVSGRGDQIDLGCNLGTFPAEIGGPLSRAVPSSAPSTSPHQHLYPQPAFVLSLRFVLFLHKPSFSRRSLDHDVRILHHDGDCVSHGQRALRIAGGRPSPNPPTRMHRRNGRKRDMPHRSNLSSRRSGKLLAHRPRPRRFRHRQVRRFGCQERQTRRQGPHVVCILPELSSL